MITKKQKKMNDAELLEYFKKFVNIVVRKFTFQHEQHLLLKDLLYFFYTVKNESINFSINEIKDNKVIELLLEEYDNNNINKSFIKEP